MDRLTLNGKHNTMRRGPQDLSIREKRTHALPATGGPSYNTRWPAAAPSGPPQNTPRTLGHRLTQRVPAAAACRRPSQKPSRLPLAHRGAQGSSKRTEPGNETVGPVRHPQNVTRKPSWGGVSRRRRREGSPHRPQPWRPMRPPWKRRPYAGRNGGHGWGAGFARIEEGARPSLTRRVPAAAACGRPSTKPARWPLAQGSE